MAVGMDMVVTSTGVVDILHTEEYKGGRIRRIWHRCPILIVLVRRRIDFVT